MKRRNLVRLLIALGIGIPILVEALTFLGLVENRLFGGGDGRRPTPTPTRRVGVGDEVLPDTPQSEIVRELMILADGERWQFTMTVAVENPDDAPYEFRLGEVTLGDGTVVRGGGSTGRLPAGVSGTAAAQWSIPAGSTPQTVVAIGTVSGGGTPAVSREEVQLAKVPVQGS